MSELSGEYPKKISKGINELYQDPVEQLFAAISAKAGRDGLEISGYELFCWYQNRGDENWDPEVVEIVRNFLKSKGVQID